MCGCGAAVVVIFLNLIFLAKFFVWFAFSYANTLTYILFYYCCCCCMFLYILSLDCKKNGQFQLIFYVVITDCCRARTVPTSINIHTRWIDYKQSILADGTLNEEGNEEWEREREREKIVINFGVLMPINQHESWSKCDPLERVSSERRNMSVKWKLCVLSTWWHLFN